MSHRWLLLAYYSPVLNELPKSNKWAIKTIVPFSENRVKEQNKNYADEAKSWNINFTQARRDVWSSQNLGLGPRKMFLVQLRGKWLWAVGWKHCAVLWWEGSEMVNGWWAVFLSKYFIKTWKYFHKAKTSTMCRTCSNIEVPLNSAVRKLIPRVEEAFFHVTSLHTEAICRGAPGMFKSHGTTSL